GGDGGGRRGIVAIVDAVAADEHVVPVEGRPLVEHVVAGAGVLRVVPGPAVQDVVPVGSRQRVVAVAAEELVVPEAAGDRVVAGDPGQQIVRAVAGDDVVRRPAGDVLHGDRVVVLDELAVVGQAVEADGDRLGPG